MKLSELKQLFNIEVLKDGDFDKLGLLIDNCKCNILSFCESEKYLNTLNENIKCLIIPINLVDKIDNFSGGIIIDTNPKLTFFNIHNELVENNYRRDTFSTIIGEQCYISERVIVSKNNVEIGDNCIIEDNVIIRENTKIGNNVIIRSGSIIGGEGFQFVRNGNDILGVKHLGGVVISNDVEIQQSCCIDKALYPWDNTIIGSNTKFDNFVHIGHATKIGENVLIAASATLSGRVMIGNNVWIGVGSTISNGITIGNNSKVNIGSVVTKNVNDNESVSGNFAIDHKKFIDFIKSIR